MALSLKSQVAALSPLATERLLASFEPWMLEEVARDEWWWTGRPEQQAPPGAWFIWLLLTGRGFGKALDVSTPVPTPTGWTTMGELSAGDVVLAADGTPTKVTYATPWQHGRTCYRVKFSDGSALVADADHQWAARTRADRRARRPYRTVTTADMLAAPVRVAGERNWQMPAAQPLDLPEAALPVAPYVLGLWLGDGDSASSVVTIGDADAPELLGALAAEGEPFEPVGYRPITYRPTLGKHTSRSLHARFRHLGVLRDKHVPVTYLRAAQRQRADLLAGLIDSDGYVNQATGLIEITLTSEKLAAGVAELARTLGHKVTWREDRASLNGKDAGPRYRVWWVARSGGGRLARKRLGDRTGLGQPDRLTTRYVEAIEPVDSRPVRCITVDHPDALYLAGDEMLVTHNTRTAAEWLADRCLRFPVDTQGFRTEWLIIAETLTDGLRICVQGPAGIGRVLQRRLGDERRSVHDGSGRWKVYRGSKPVIQLWDKTGAEAQVIYIEGADDEDVGRGYNAAGAWLDEMAKWHKPDGAWIEGIAPSLRAELPDGEFPRVVVATTPKLVAQLVEWRKRSDGSVYVTTGSTYDNASNLPKVILDELTLRYQGTRIGRQELLGELIEEVVGAMWSLAWIERDRRQPAQMPGLGLTVIGMDPAGTGERDETGLICASRGDDGHDYILGDWSKQIAGAAAARRAWEMYRAYSADWIIIESNMAKKWVKDVMVQEYKAMQKEGLFPAGGAPPLKLVAAKVGKKLRAEPVAARYEQGNRVHHVKGQGLGDLETQMVSWVPDDTPDSPDRIDALVYACLALYDRERQQVGAVSPVGYRLPVTTMGPLA